MLTRSDSFSFVSDEETDDYTGGVPPQVLKLKKLELLDLSWQVSNATRLLS